MSVHYFAVECGEIFVCIRKIDSLTENSQPEKVCGVWKRPGNFLKGKY